MEVSGQLHVPVALPTGKMPKVPFGYEAGWAPELVWTFWRTGKTVLTKSRGAKKYDVASRWKELHS
jgi:hypothetical protein